MLRELFEKQAELNKRVGFDADKVRENMDLKESGEWLNNYLAAMSSEIEELRDCTYWKHWCKEAREGRRFEIHDLQNARVEVTDMLFFWISLCHCLGLTADDVYNLYQQKLGVNHSRQDNNYSMSEKTEDDNKTVNL
ncbi:dUTPase [Sedimentisphaera salicampi]|uniref:dCTP pyrophosphatase n=1 Tax=Sedimentisphaera salicampi TaxID=1941349 RepID=A0A1W6LPK2_9BACT|nr:dUTPase [Sedimentisphaera salicampi]ARN57710.1 dCTP pyrophosphatase [Sedimentisphaera salicampi]OXU14268.1 dCTP pyrophosphatase [Sedimentisphaera salicampi]